MIDSTNVRVLADNISKLWDKIKSISGDLLPSRSTATTGQILKLTGENKTPAWADEYSYTPPAFSTTETATGQKWIDGKDIYCKSSSGTIPDDATNPILIEAGADTNIIAINGSLTYTNNTTYPIVVVGSLRRGSSGNVVITNAQAIYGASYVISIFYTKPDPTPGDAKGPEEPEEKKTTKKKSSK